ncbi:MAG: UDP-2,3-diacylglucosamine diphosphatase LpxI [Alphaproteobacteria bacterium]|nr:UDP-2,3-diacylglucosamine diphosphatase LpxI [Alphaproteobacteria bacterium]
MSSHTKRLGLIAGSGVLPKMLLEAAQTQNYHVFTAGIKKAVEPDFPTDKQFRVEQLAHAADYFLANDCKQIVIIGGMTRPNLLTLRPDKGGLKVLRRILATPKRGDNVLFVEIIRYFTERGLEIIAPESILGKLAAPQGLLTKREPTAEQKQDMARAIQVTRQIGQLDIGQSSVVCRGQVLAVEGAEGTDEMLRRIANMAESLRGTPKARCGVLVKFPKPKQDRRIDLPALGVTSVELAAAAGLAGIVFEAGGALINELPLCIEQADKAGLFLLGVEKTAPEFDEAKVGT